jgi:hypothetical protein
MKRTGSVLLLASLALILAGCGGTRVLVPPRIDLRQHEIIGVMQFESSSRGVLAQLATRKFVEAVRADQGMVRIVDLGTEAELLQAVGSRRLDRDAIRAIGRKYQVATLIAGELDVSDVRPGAAVVTPGLTFASITAEVTARLSASMIETAAGASIWSNSASQTHKVGQVSFFGGKSVAFDAKDPERAYGKMVNSLVLAITPDFRARWERRRD